MANLNIHVDDTLKEQAETVFADPFYSDENQSRLIAAKERMEKTGGAVHDLVEVDKV